MKICPFISHMIGEEKTNVLEVENASADGESQAAADAIILGYDGEGSVAVKSKTKSKTRSKAKTRTKSDSKDQSSHLFCIKDTCRFYRKKSAECMFDNMFEMMDTQSKEAAKPQSKPADDKATAKITKELDKFWKFQTASVAELISSIGEAEKKQGETLDGFRKEVQQRLDGATKEEAPWADEVRTGMSRLQNALEAREESAESFSTTVSEIVVSVEDGMKSMREKTDDILDRIEKLERTVDNFGVIEKHIESAVRSLENVETRVETAVSQSIGEMSMPNVSNDVRSVSDQVAEFVDSTRKFESRFENWQRKMESRVDEIHSGQESWGTKLGDIARRQDQVIATLESGAQKKPESNVPRSQNREAKKLNNLGVKSFHNGELEMARDQFQQAVVLDDQFAESYNNLGLVFTELGEQDRATAAYEQAIALNPDLHAAYNNLGYVFYLRGNYERAVDMYKEALRRAPENSSARTNLGNAYYKMGKNKDARDAWKRALELDPGNEKASRNLERLDTE